MVVYKHQYRLDGPLFENRLGNTVSLIDIQDQIVRGKSVRVLNSRTNEDITQSILLKIISYNSDESGGAYLLNRELEELIRDRARSSELNDVSTLESKFDIDTLSVWANYIEEYGDLWSGDFGRRYYAREYTYLIGKILVYHWKQQPIEIETAIALLGQGSRKTRLTRLKNLISEGWIARTQHAYDRRRTVIQPTEEMQSLGRLHLARALVQAIESLKTVVHFNTNVSSIIDVIKRKNNGSIDQTHLLPWAECLMSYADSWAKHFGGEFPKLEYVNLFTHVVLSSWKNEHLMFDKLSTHIKAGSPRTHKSQIDRGIELNLIKRSKLKIDRRISIYSPRPKLEHLVRSYYTQTLERFMSLIKKLSPK